MDEILREAFSRARHRVGLIFLDILWKAIWLVGTVSAVFLVIVWFGSELRGIAWEDTGVRAVNALIMVMVFRQFWAANGAAIYSAPRRHRPLRQCLVHARGLGQISNGGCRRRFQPALRSPSHGGF